ncbi:hypothetical protein [Pseudactinotalea suaedae]|uniref:hypothetical protein n=1 Tax=Pseudactinotalea suaedae TaxID=1524924 RepID=UPI0012E1D5C9|nr:hypothetical protein [Pseudactinotalea suaedae]
MGFLDRLFGRNESYQPGGTPRHVTPMTPDDRAVDRYRYLLRTAPPDQVEQAHAEAFARLTPEQRTQVQAELGSAVPAAERPATDSPTDLARSATRAEVREPGTLERTFGGRDDQGFGRGGAGFGGGLLGTVAGVVIGTAVAQSMFGAAFADPAAESPTDAQSDGGGEPGSEPGGSEAGGDGGAAGATDAGAVEPGGFDPGAFDAGGFDAGGFDGGF